MAALAAAAVIGAAALATTAAAAAAPDTIAWSEVVASYAGVRDYTALYEKQERAIDGGALQRIRLSFRKPLDVRMEWLDGKGKVDQTAVYRQGYNDGKVVAHRSGLLGSLAGTVHLDPRGSLALQDSRHPIMEVGIGPLIDRVAADLREGRITARPAVEATVDGQPVWRLEFETASAAPLFGIDGARRAMIEVEQARKLPIAVVILDRAGAVIERHRFTRLALNVGLTDAVFALS